MLQVDKFLTHVSHAFVFCLKSALPLLDGFWKVGLFHQVGANGGRKLGCI